MRWRSPFDRIGLLIEDGSFPDEYAVPCLVMPAEHAHHASLIENVARKAAGEGKKASGN